MDLSSTSSTPVGSSTSRRQAIFFLVLTAFLWSSSGLLVKIISWGPLSIVGGRSLLASVLFLVYLRRVPLRWTWLQVAGAVAYSTMQLAFITATKMTTAANAILLQYTAPIYVILLAYWLLKERPRRGDWIAMPVILVGLLLFFGDGLNVDGLYGNLLAILSGVAMAALTLCMRGQKTGAPAQTVLLGNVINVFVGLPFLLQESWTLPDVGILFYLGLVQIGLSFLLYSIAIRHVPAVESTLILTLEPILNPLWVFLVIGEVPGHLALLGGGLVLVAATSRALSSALQAQEA